VNFRQMTYFVAVAEERSFRKAAERLGISQPSLSVQIKDLEARLGAQLLNRTTQKVSLTANGEIFYHRVRAILDSVHETRREMKRRSSGKSAIRIGYMSAAMLSTLTPILSCLRKETREIVLDLYQMSPDDQLNAISKGHIDAGFVDFQAGRGRIGSHDKALAIVSAWREQLVIALPNDHPLAKQECVSISQIREEPLIILSRNPFFGFYDSVLEMLSQLSAEPAIVHEARDMAQILTLVSAGFGISMAPALSCRIWADLVRLVPLDRPAWTEVSLVHRTDNQDKTLRKLIEIVEAGWQKDQVAPAK